MNIKNLDSCETVLELFENVDGIIAAPPCTDFAVSGAQFWKAKDEDGRTKEAIELVRQVIRLVDLFKPTDPDFYNEGGTFFWAVENPVGRIGKLIPELGNPFYFHPHEYAGHLNLSAKNLKRLDNLRKQEGENITKDDADFIQRCNAYTKKTGLWGEFDKDKLTQLKKNIQPVKACKQGSVTQRAGGKSAATKEYRSNTPLGFAHAFYQANQNYKITEPLCTH